MGSGYGTIITNSIEHRFFVGATYGGCKTRGILPIEQLFQYDSLKTLGEKDFRGFRWVRGFVDKTLLCISPNRTEILPIMNICSNMSHCRTFRMGAHMNV